MEDKLDTLEQIVALLLKDRYTEDLTDNEEEKLHNYFMWGIE